MGCVQSADVAQPRQLTPPAGVEDTNSRHYSHEQSSLTLGSEDTMFQYSDQSSSYVAPPPATLRTDTFIANELQEYPSSIDNIWSDPGPTTVAPPPESGRNIWTIQSGQPSWRNIWGLISQKGGQPLASSGGNLWNSHSSTESTVKNVWSQQPVTTSGSIPTSSHPPASVRGPKSKMNVIQEDAVLPQHGPNHIPVSALRVD